MPDTDATSRAVTQLIADAIHDARQGLPNASPETLAECIHRVLAAAEPHRFLPPAPPTRFSVSYVAWHPASTAPPRSKAPYHLFLVWLRAETGPVEYGIPKIVQRHRDRGWVSEQLDGLVITHWAEAIRPFEAGPARPWQAPPPSEDAGIA